MNGYDTDTVGEDLGWVLRLLDCLIKHRNMIANPLYGVLGLVTMSYQLVFELLGPIWSILYMYGRGSGICFQGHGYYG